MRPTFPALARGVSRSRVLAGFPRAARPGRVLAAHAPWPEESGGSAPRTTPACPGQSLTCNVTASRTPKTLPAALRLAYIPLLKAFLDKLLPPNDP